MGNMKYKNSSKFLNRIMEMGGGMDMSEEFERKMRKGGDTMKPSYKYGGAKNILIKKQIGGQSPFVTYSGKKSKK